jgi:hypothetical protein
MSWWFEAVGVKKCKARPLVGVKPVPAMVRAPLSSTGVGAVTFGPLDWVTVSVALPPDPVTVIWPVRGDVSVLGATLYEIEPPVVPEAGVIPVIHVISLEADQEQAVERVVLNEPPVDGTAWMTGLSVYVHVPAWFTVWTALPPGPVIVMCPVRAVVPVLDATAYVIVPPVAPDAGVIPVIHVTSLEAVQEHDVVSTVLNEEPPAARTDCTLGLSAYVHAPDWVTVSWALPPAPWTLMWPVRATVSGFAATVYAIVPPVVPVLGETPVIHDTSLAAVHEPEHDPVRVSAVLDGPPAARKAALAGVRL